MTRGRALRIAAVAGLALGALTVGTAAATVSLTNSSVSCRLTANQPVLSKTKQLTGSATISCVAYKSSNVQVTVQVVERDGPVVDQMGGVFFVAAAKTLSASSKAVTWTLTTPAKSCVNADGTGTGAAYEDYYTVALISVGGTVSETVGTIDGWNC